MGASGAATKPFVIAKTTEKRGRKLQAFAPGRNRRLTPSEQMA